MNNTITATQAPERYLEAFDEFNHRSATQLGWLKSLRQEGFGRFSETGFPTTHDEDWRFTNVAPIANTGFQAAQPVEVKADSLERFGASAFACQLVFVNGRFSRELSQLPSLAPDLNVCGLAQALATNAAEIREHLGQYLDFRRDAFAALNTAFLEDGAYVYVPRGAVIDLPIYVLYVSVPGSVPSVEHPRNLIVVEENSQATIVEDYISLQVGGGFAPSFSNTATELVAGENAVVSHYMVVRQADNS
ncbi:MAG: SufD family Fe-S cluster assembly protein, partial [Candidatus Angelobacter sp.]